MDHSQSASSNDDYIPKKMMNPHFTLADFERSDYAARLGIDNSVPPALQARALETLEMMERIRCFLSNKAGHDVPIFLSSGYRNVLVNSAIGGEPKSDHLKAAACDWRAPSFGTPYAICKALAPSIQVLGIGQLIHEYGRWVHTSLNLPMQPINRVITRTTAGTTAGIKEV